MLIDLGSIWTIYLQLHPSPSILWRFSLPRLVHMSRPSCITRPHLLPYARTASTSFSKASSLPPPNRWLSSCPARNRRQEPKRPSRAGIPCLEVPDRGTHAAKGARPRMKSSERRLGKKEPPESYSSPPVGHTAGGREAGKPTQLVTLASTLSLHLLFLSPSCFCCVALCFICF